MEFLEYIGILVKEADEGDESPKTTKEKYKHAFNLLQQIQPQVDSEEEVATWICGAYYLSIQLHLEKEKELYQYYIEQFSKESSVLHKLIQHKLEFIVLPDSLHLPNIDPPKINISVEPKEIKNVFQLYNIHILYINLKHRTDRKQSIEFELFKKVNMLEDKVTRIEAIYHELGCYGCSLSHILRLEKCLSNNRIRDDVSSLNIKDAEYFLMIEDDFTFINKIEVIYSNLYDFLKEVKTFDVVMLTGSDVVFDLNDNKKKKYKRIKSANNASAYLICKHYIPKLLNNLKISSKLLLESKGQHWKYALDQYWKRLQKEDQWYIFDPPLGHQNKKFKSDSDINVISRSLRETDLNQCKKEKESNEEKNLLF